MSTDFLGFLGYGTLPRPTQETVLAFAARVVVPCRYRPAQVRWACQPGQLVQLSDRLPVLRAHLRVNVVEGMLAKD